MHRQVNTVRGPIPVRDIGITLTHEHLWMDTVPLYYRQQPALQGSMCTERVTPANRDFIWSDKERILHYCEDNIRFDNIDDMVEELKDFTAAGGSTIFEVTPHDLGRDPLALREISEKSGVNIVMGGTHYYLPCLDEETLDVVYRDEKKAVSLLADRMIAEFDVGVGDTGVKPGVLGEVGLRHEPTNRILARAALIAQRETGAPAIFHYAPLWILDMAEEVGADLSKIVMGHWSMAHPVEEAIRRGAWVSFDQFGMNFPGILTDEERAGEVLAMFERGWEKQLLLSMDICWKVRLKKCGGGGYADIFRSAFPLLIEKGIRKEQLLSLLRDNPQRLLE